MKGRTGKKRKKIKKGEMGGFDTVSKNRTMPAKEGRMQKGRRGEKKVTE